MAMGGHAIVADELERCRTQLAGLRAFGTDVSGLLRGMSRELLDSGRPPTLADIDQLTRIRAEFAQLKSEISRESEIPESERLEEGGRSEDVGEDRSLTEIQEELESRGLIRATLSKLECVAMIQHAGQPDFAPWRRCQEDGTRLREELLSAPVPQARVTAERFLEPQSPLNAIATLVTEGEDLSDERWTQLLDSVSSAYGREVSTAIARGKLIVTSGTTA
jgi:hypothetical protein